MYGRAGLTRNPFVADGPDGAPTIDRRITRPPVEFVQVVGERGSGKTTLLRHWQQIHGGTYHYVRMGRARWLPVPIRQPAVYWDEADRLPRVVVKRALRAARLRGITVVVGTHRNLAGPAAAAGMTTAVVRLDHLSRDELSRWIDLKITAAATDPRRARAVLGEAPIDEVMGAVGSSWREAGDRLHVWAAERIALARDEG